MNLQISPFQLHGCQCRIKFDPKELQSLLDDELKKGFGKHKKYLDSRSGELTVTGGFSEIDEGNFALHFMLALLGKAWIAGHMRVEFNGQALLDEPFRIRNTYAAFTGPKGQLKGDTKYLAGQIVKKSIKALKQKR